MLCLEYLALVDMTKKSCGGCMSKLSSPSLPPAPFACALHVLFLSQLCHLGPAAAGVLPPAAL